ncbi:MAG TPA: hypothetical protein VJL09_01275 [Candidatus Paceibacterota bacterium]
MKKRAFACYEDETGNPAAEKRVEVDLGEFDDQAKADREAMTRPVPRDGLVLKKVILK